MITFFRPMLYSHNHMQFLRYINYISNHISDNLIASHFCSGYNHWLEILAERKNNVSLSKCNNKIEIGNSDFVSKCNKTKSNRFSIDI